MGWLSARPDGAVRATVSSLVAPQRTRGGAGADRSRALDRQPQQRTVFEAELYRLKARAVLTRGAPDAEAESLLDQALQVARSQQARSLELRAATDLAMLWRSEGKRPEARDVLESIYCRFSEGFDTRDLKEAKALLAQLQ